MVQQRQDPAMRLDDMAYFVEVAKLRSFRRAADTLGVPNSTVSRHIRALETDLGLRLFTRSTRKIELTEAGKVFFDRSQKIVEDAQEAYGELAGLRTDPGGRLRVCMSVDFAVTYLSGVIADFVRNYPKIQLELDLTPRNSDLVVEHFDVAIRMRPMPDSQMIARVLTKLPLQLYAAPEYLHSSGKPLAPEDLTERQCLDFSHVKTWRLQRGGEEVAVPISGRVRTNNPGLSKKLAALGLGIVLLPQWLVSDEVASGELVRVLEDWQGEPAPVFIVTESKLIPAKAQLFIAFLQDHVGAMGASIEHQPNRSSDSGTL